MPGDRSINILVIDDNYADVEIVMRALQRSKVVHQLKVINDGEEALSFFKNMDTPSLAQGIFQPQLIILDLNLPKFSGFDILKAVRFNKRLESVPVIMLTTSDEDEDIIKSYKLGASSFVTKPTNPKEFSHLVQEIEKYWTNVARLP